MKKGLICVVLATLLLTSLIGTIPAKETSQPAQLTDTRALEVQKVCDNLKARFDTVTTRQEAVGLMHDALIELNYHGMLPKDMTLRKAQRRLDQALARAHLPITLSAGANGTGNTNCLIFGFTTSVYLWPSLSLYDHVNHSTLFGRAITFFFALRTFSLVKCGQNAQIGYKFLAMRDGNISVNRIEPAKGFVWTMGTNGIQKWNGTFCGAVNCTHVTFTDGSTSYDWWDTIGIRGFAGISLLNFIAQFAPDKGAVPTIYIGFARQVNMTYHLPWT